MESLQQTIPDQLGNLAFSADSLSLDIKAPPLAKQPALLAPPAVAHESMAQFIRRTTSELLKTKFALMTFVVNTLRRRYHNSILGFAWSLLNPLLNMGVMTFVFALIFHKDPAKFAIYLFSGMLPWSFVAESLISGSTALVNFENFLKKICLPKAFFPLVVVSIAACNFVFSLVSLLVLGLCYGLHPSSSLLLLPVATLVLFVFNFGLALILSVATLYLRDLTHIVSVLLGSLFYTMPIIYPIEQIPKQYQAIFVADPFYCFLSLFKTIIYEGQLPALGDWCATVAFAITALAVSLVVLKWREKDIVYRI